MMTRRTHNVPNDKYAIRHMVGLGQSVYFPVDY
jgi:hypothetical protein